LQEQFAISVKRNRDAKNNVGADFGKLADIEDRLFRQKFMQKQNTLPGSNSDLMKMNTQESDKSFATFQSKEEPKAQAAEAEKEESTVVTSDEMSSQNNAQESVQDNNTTVKSDPINQNQSQQEASTSQSQQESSADNNDTKTK